MLQRTRYVFLCQDNAERDVIEKTEFWTPKIVQLQCQHYQIYLRKNIPWIDAILNLQRQALVPYIWLSPKVRYFGSSGLLQIARLHPAKTHLNSDKQAHKLTWHTTLHPLLLRVNLNVKCKFHFELFHSTCIERSTYGWINGIDELPLWIFRVSNGQNPIRK